MKFLDDIFETFNNKCINGLTDELKVLYILFLKKKYNKNILVLSNSLYNSSKFFNMINIYEKKSYFFPMDDFVSSVMDAASPDLMVKRLDTIDHLNESNSIFVTNLEGYLKFMPSSKELNEASFNIKPGDKINREEFEKSIFDFGYKKSSVVTSTGEYSIRGFIIDIFPFNYNNPLRIEFFGNEVECIKEFDIDNQLSINKISNILIKPFGEIKTKERNSLYQLLNNPLVVMIDSDMIEKSYYHLQEIIADYIESNNIINAEKYMFDLDEIKVDDLVQLNSFDNKNGLRVSSNVVDSFKSNMEQFIFYLEHRNKDLITLLSIYSKNLKDNLSSLLNISNDSNFLPGNIYFLDDKVNHGFIINNYMVITENDIISGSFNSNYNNPIKIGRKIKNFSDIKVGDFIVHRSHGIGVYGGVVNLNKNGFNKDYLLLNYGKNDKIYIPVEKINTIYKYADAGSENVKVNSLNSLSWSKAKRKVKARIKDITDELVKLYAERSKILSPKFKEVPEELLFSGDFDFVETKDQIRCINDVLSDLSSNKPMDRLLCGDVGFGKTEVAFRAIFRTVMNGYQAVYLCPTTILSKQQYKSALHRFRNFPVNIALINRFTTNKELKNILDDVKNGKIDILFGTHKLFNDMIEYKKLGLLVIDEEQRFGVTQKEKIKKTYNNINVLTLSATPIPRTLKMAVSGLRDLSILDTAPVNRYPVQTYVAEDNDFFVKDIIYKELARNGQIYYLYNSVEDLNNEVSRLTRLVPEARICFAHGRLDKTNLEKVIDDFVNYKYDILVCTTIIETGIDISNVNTLIIKNAQNFGLSQLYQIRGRVGRSNRIAYAYLLYNNDKILSEIAIKRLNAIKEFTELGSGYKIAMRDLSIRGAGDLLGSEQAGFIETVGIDLFTKMVEESVNELNGIFTDDEENNGLSLIDVDTHISTDYIEDESVRIEIHQLINNVSNKESLDKIKSEIEDRFGHVDEKLIIYMYEEWFEKLALRLKINRVIQTKSYIEVELPVEISNKINGEKLFMISYNICPNLKFRYLNKKIFIKLNFNSLNKHYLYYLIPLLEEIINDIE